ncbi:MAG TPA: ATP-binding protein [Acidimicrobiales bacterium]|nr:ATP-binding protein [Acidimicrobiales bacterium]
MRKIQRHLVRVLVVLAAIAAIGFVLLPLRGHIDRETIGLVLVIPVFAAVAAGGYIAGVVAVGASFLVYDVLFIPPYGSLTVGPGQNWVPLGVYTVVMLAVARILASLRRARGDAARREAETRRLFELSEALTADQPLPVLLAAIVNSVYEAFGLTSVFLLLPEGDGFNVAAQAGESLTVDELRAVFPVAGELRSLAGVTTPAGRLFGIPLAAAGRPIGLLVFAGKTIPPGDLGSLRTYANQAAIAVERARLREQTVQAELLRRVDGWRAALLGAVSHDLRTPLSSVKAAVSDLRRADLALSREDSEELLALIETQSDRLARLVTNLLDMTRIEFGELELRRKPTALERVLDDALASFGAAEWVDRVVASFPADLPPVDIDRLLVCQILANLLENAERHAPEGSPISVSGRTAGKVVEVSVEDCGPGVPEADRDRIFKMFNRVSGGGRAGIGLAIVQAFVEAHGQSVRVETAAGGGARFVFTLPVATAAVEVA